MSADAETAEPRISFDVSIVSDPVGVVLNVTVADRLPDEAQQALLADLRDELVDQQGNLVFASVRVSHGTLRSYGQRNDYDVEPVTETVEIVTVAESSRSLTIRWEWDHEAAGFFQFGVSPHTIDGDPILSFIWEDAPQGVKEMFANTERVDGDPRVFFQSVNHPGIPASRFVQAGINWLRQEVS
ncbi:hypothetical protein OSG_eHP14_00210 [environmental Halophage eHP-14]|nr:hypothetical protein OSG_eHP14_00210 [environmental Halophage eHP-14]